MHGCQPGTGTYGGICGGLGRGMRLEQRSGKRFPRRRDKFGRRQVKATPIPGVAFFVRGHRRLHLFKRRLPEFNGRF